MSPESPKFNQLQEQHEQGAVVPATVLVERSDGSIDTGHVFQGEGSLGSSVVHLEPDAEGYAAHKTASTEALSDEYQQKLARELGGKALKGEVESEDIQDDEQFDAMFNMTDEEAAKITPEDAAVRRESPAVKLARERRWADEKDAAMKRVGRPEMN